MTNNEKTKEELIREVAGIYKKLAQLEEPNFTNEKPTLENLPDIVLPFLKGPSVLFKEAEDTFVLVGDSDGQIIYFNDVAEQISGYSAGEVVGKIGWELFMDLEEAERVKTLVKNNEVDQERKENIWIAKDGSRRIIKWLSYADIGGGQYHIIKGIDITEHKNTLDSLKESREQYRMLFESMSEGFGIFEFVFGNEGQLSDAKVIEVNPALEKMFNAERNQVVGRSITEIFPNVVADDFVRFCSAIDNHEPLRFINMTAPKHKWFDIKAYSLENGNHYALVVRDISELKLMLERLSASEERFHKAFHNSPEMMVLIRMSDDVFLETNQQFLDNLEYTREEILEIKPVRLLKPGQESYYEIILKDLSEQGTIKNVELQFLTKTCKVLTFLCSFQIISLDDQSCRLVVLKDITKEKQLEKDLLRLDRLHLVGEMAASIGHEIRNPMTSVRGFLQLLSMNDERSENQEYYALMIEEIDRANAIITEFLSMSRAKTVVLEPRNLNDIVEAIYPMIKAESLMNNKEIRLELKKLPLLMLDEKEIRQLVLNLVRNGLEAMEAGGTLIIGSREDESDWVLYFKDEGEGFAPEMISRAGTPFISTKENGIGLGLAVCYSIAERHNARLEIDTGPEGTTVSVKFSKSGRGL
ncbi:MAG: PAS domain S-box protein [Syntrophomonas sp.]